MIPVILFNLFPYKCPCVWIGCIKKYFISSTEHRDPHTALTLHQIPFFFHLTEIFRTVIHRRPHRNHQLHAQLFQPSAHSRNIRPVFWIKPEISFLRPVKEICNDHIHRNSKFMVFFSYCQKFLLCTVAKFALPESQAILRHHRRFSCQAHIIFFNFRRRVSGDHKIINLFRRFRFPFRTVHCKGYTSNRRIIPQKSIAKTGNIKRYADLRISLRKFQHTPFHIHLMLLILSHSKYFFLVICQKSDRCLIIFSVPRPVFSSKNIQRSADLILKPSPVFFQQHSPVFFLKRQYSVRIDHCTDLSITDGSVGRIFSHIHVRISHSIRTVIFKNFHSSMVFCRFFQRPVLLCKNTISGCAHSQCVFAPWFYTHSFPVIHVI